MRKGYGNDMINLLHSELYKLKKSKSYKVAAVLSVLFVLFTYALFGAMQAMGARSADSGEAEIMQKLSGISIMDQMSMLEQEDTNYRLSSYCHVGKTQQLIEAVNPHG